MHQNEDAYPEPIRFIPERWLINGDQGRDRCFAPFQKGNHACIGIKYVIYPIVGCMSWSADFRSSLAYMQLYIGIAYTVMRFDLELCEPVSDWDWIDRAGAKPAWPVWARVVHDYASGGGSQESHVGV
jgi:hypothetical protein